MDYSEVRSISQDNTSITIYFKRNIQRPFNRNIDTDYILSIEASGFEFTVNFLPEADFAIFNTNDGISIIASARAQSPDVLLSYGVGTPLLKKETSLYDDPESKRLLNEADAYIGAGNYAQAEIHLQHVTESAKNPIYAQEAMYKLGKLYLTMGMYNPNAYYDATITFDEFLKKYPASTRAADVRALNAEAKMQTGQSTDAIKIYSDIYKNSTDAQTKREALLNIAEVYKNTGQYDRAIETYREYLNNFESGASQVTLELGRLYMSKDDKNRAYNAFAEIPENVIKNSLSSEELLRLAEIYIEKSDKDKTYDLLKYMANNNYPQSPEAMYLLAQQYKKDGDILSYSATLKEITDKFGDGDFYRKALVEYAELHYAEKSATEWRQFLYPLYIGEDVFDLRPRAAIVYIKAMYKDNDNINLIPLIDEYLALYSTSEMVDYLKQIREEALYSLGKTSQDSGSFVDALKYYEQFLVDFPQSSRFNEVSSAIDDIYFSQAMILYNAGNFTETAAYAEDYMSKRNAAERWFRLWEDSLYSKIKESVDPKIIRLQARDYLTGKILGIYEQEVKQILLNAFDEPFYEAVGNENYPEMIPLYEENADWLSDLPDQSYNNRVKILTALAMLNIGTTDAAEKLYNESVPMINEEYAILSYALCKQTPYDINNLSVAKFLKVIDDAERRCGGDYSLKLAKKYSDNVSASLNARYNLLKNIPEDRIRNAALTDIYSQISANNALRFPGYENVFFDSGMEAYRRNNFTGATTAFKQFIDADAEKSEDRLSEALYYMGKSLWRMGDRALASQYYNRLISEMPDSVYKSMARSEMEDDAWRSSMQNR